MKTKPTDNDTVTFLNSLTNEKKRRDSFKIMELMQEITGAEPIMWGPSIIGFGSYHYKYASGREGDWFLTGFSPRKQAITLYLNYGFAENETLITKLGKYKTGKACLYVKKIEDIDLDVLYKLIKQSVEHVAKTNA